MGFKKGLDKPMKGILWCDACDGTRLSPVETGLRTAVLPSAPNQFLVSHLKNKPGKDTITPLEKDLPSGCKVKHSDARKYRLYLSLASYNYAICTTPSPCLR